MYEKLKILIIIIKSFNSQIKFIRWIFMSSIFTSYLQNKYPWVFAFLKDYREFSVDYKEGYCTFGFLHHNVSFYSHKYWIILSQFHNGYFLNPLDKNN